MNVALRSSAHSEQGPPLGPYRRADYDALPDEPRCELIWGRFHLSSSPTLDHQLITGSLRNQLDDLVKPGGGMALAAPLDVPLAEHSVVQPDVVVVRAANLQLLRNRWLLVPELLVEVASPSTSRLDRGEKLALYLACGVREYWLIDPRARTVEFLINDNSRFVPALPRGGVYQSQILAEVHIDLDRFWAEIARRLDLPGLDAPG